MSAQGQAPRTIGRAWRASLGKGQSILSSCRKSIGWNSRHGELKSYLQIEASRWESSRRRSRRASPCGWLPAGFRLGILVRELDETLFVMLNKDDFLFLFIKYCIKAT